jgi:uncharacterized protein involved in exopolysaccharide biosynthesis
MTTETLNQEDEINLRLWVAMIVQNIRWVLGVTVAAALVGFTVVSLLPRMYEATALAVVSSSQSQLNFDPRIETVGTPNQNFGSYASLALSDDLLAGLYAGIAPNNPKIENLKDLRELLSAEVRVDMVYLTARAPHPQSAAQIANLWMDLFVERTNQVYYRAGDREQLAFYEQQLAEARQALEQTDQALVDFQGENRIELLNNQLNVLNRTRLDYLNQQRSIALFLQDIDSLVTQLRRQDAATPASPAIQLSVLQLQIGAYQSQASLPFQVQITNPETLTGATVGDQIRLLSDLRQVTEARLSNLDAELEALEPQILDIQRQVQELNVTRDDLLREQSLAAETVQILARQVSEASIQARDTGGQVRLASRASPPDEPSSLGRLLATILGAAIGLVSSVVGVSTLEWWRQPEAVVKKSDD